MKKIFRLITFGALLFFTHKFWMPFIGSFLLVDDRLVKADCMIVLRAEEGLRFEKAAQLYKEGWAPAIVFSVIPQAGKRYDIDRKVFGYDHLNEVQITEKFFEYFNVPSRALVFTSYETTSTYEEALAAKEVMVKRGWRSCLLVTSTYHMRRAKFLFQEVFKGTGIEIYPVTAPNALLDPQTWWQRERDIRRVFEEYISFGFNAVYRLILKNVRTSFDTT